VIGESRHFAKHYEGLISLTGHRKVACTIFQVNAMPSFGDRLIRSLGDQT